MRFSASVKSLSATATIAALSAFAAPAAQAAVTNVTMSNAGYKQVGLTTYAWGTATGGAGAKVCTQVLVGTNWSTSQCQTADANGNYAIELTFGKSTAGLYTWRVVANSSFPSAPQYLVRGYAATGLALPYVSGAAPDYVRGRTTNGYVLGKDYNGVKVWGVQKAFGMNPGPMDSTLNTSNPVGATTVAKIKAFQNAFGLNATGFVDANTFYAIKDYAPYKAALANYNFDMDWWQQPSKVTAGVTHTARVDAMISWITGKLGKPYIWGGTGDAGYDCSGLVLNALRAGGFTSTTLTNEIDVLPASDLANHIYLDTAELPRVSGTPQPGDLIFYGGSNGIAGHVAMVLSSTKIVSAYGTKVQTSNYGFQFGWAKTLGMSRMP